MPTDWAEERLHRRQGRLLEHHRPLIRLRDLSRGQDRLSEGGEWVPSSSSIIFRNFSSRSAFVPFCEVVDFDEVRIRSSSCSSSEASFIGSEWVSWLSSKGSSRDNEPSSALLWTS